jgi:hypothetical protein
VQIDFTVRTPANTAVAGVPLRIARGSTIFGGKTTVDGELRTEADVAGDATRVVVKVSDEPVVPRSFSERDAEREQFKQIITKYVFRTSYVVTLQPGVSHYDMAIEAAPGRAISGRFVSSAGSPIAGTVIARDAVGVVQCGSDGRFTTGGAREGQPFELFLYNGSDVISRKFPAGAGPADVGDIAAATAPRNGRVQVAIPDWPAFAESTRTRPEWVAAGATLISMDGSQIWTRLRQGGAIGGGEAEWRVPAGTYAVVPGYFGGHAFQTRALDVLRSNGSIAGWGSCEVRVPADGDVSISIEAVPLVAAIEATQVGGN